VLCTYAIFCVNLCISVLYIYEYLICVMYLCHLLWHKLMFVYSKCIWKWFVWWLREMVLTYSKLKRLALCSLQTNVLFLWLREPVKNTTLQSHVYMWISCVTYQTQLLWHKVMFVYSKCIWKWFVWWTCDDSVKWYWHTVSWSALHCVVCRQMFCFSGRENQWRILHYSHVYMWISYLCYIPDPTFVTQTNVCL